MNVPDTVKMKPIPMHNVIRNFLDDGVWSSSNNYVLSTEAKSGKAVGVDASWALGVIAGIAGTLVAIVIIALLARRRQHPPMQYEGKRIWITVI